MLLLIILCLFYRATIAQSPTVVCVPGLCVQGFTNVSLGVSISSPSIQTKVILLPGQYTSTTNPQLLHDVLTSPSSTLSTSPGFEKSSSSRELPMSVAIEPGLAVYPQSLYSGAPHFIQLPPSLANGSQLIPLPPTNALLLSPDIYAILGTTSNEHIVLWDSVPDMNQLPLSQNISFLSLIEIQSSSCSTPCSSAGLCSPGGKTCLCPPNFAGSSCEDCAPGFFGPSCLPCPACANSKCDQGISGTGRCLNPQIPTALETCNCLNGRCSSTGGCECNPGWTTADSGIACAKCDKAKGFFQDPEGNCRVCPLSCTECADGQGACTACIPGFALDSKGVCAPAGVKCPDGFFGDGEQCVACAGGCKTCAGSADTCVVCASGSFTLNGECVRANADGICGDTSLIADNVNHVCNACDAKCTACRIPNFDLGTVFDKRECTACVAGSVLSDGRCIDECPSGTFLSPEDNLTCKPCDPSCGGSCAGSPTFCLTCPNDQLVFNGTCVSTCPTSTFQSESAATKTKTCVACHPDCLTCSGSSFSQCLTCPLSLPIKAADGPSRCIKTCSRTQYFDIGRSACGGCDESCSSCAGPGPGKCLACSSAREVLRSGECVAPNPACDVLPGLGVCLSELIRVSGAPTIKGIGDPTTSGGSGRRSLEWWQILLMALGCAFIFMVMLMLWRRRARRQRAERSARWGAEKELGASWRKRFMFMRFGKRVFGRNQHTYTEPMHGNDVKLKSLGDVEKGRHPQHELDMDNFLSLYQHSDPPSLAGRPRDLQPESNELLGPTLYSQVMGKPRLTPNSQQPVRDRDSGGSYSLRRAEMGESSKSEGPSKNPFSRFI